MQSPKKNSIESILQLHIEKNYSYRRKHFFSRAYPYHFSKKEKKTNAEFKTTYGHEPHFFFILQYIVRVKLIIRTQTIAKNSQWLTV